MNSIVLEQVPVAELPAAWRSMLDETPGATVTVRIESGHQPTVASEPIGKDDPLFGMWRDREDMADVAGDIRAVRASRFGRESRPED